jgi:putative transposase
LPPGLEQPLVDQPRHQQIQRLIADTLAKQNIPAGQLTIHADRGSSMTSRTVAQLLCDLDVVRSHSRPRISNDCDLADDQPGQWKARGAVDRRTFPA